MLDARKMKGSVPTRSGVHLSDQVSRIIDDMGYASSKVGISLYSHVLVIYIW